MYKALCSVVKAAWRSRWRNLSSGRSRVSYHMTKSRKLPSQLTTDCWQLIGWNFASHSDAISSKFLNKVILDFCMQSVYRDYSCIPGFRNSSADLTKLWCWEDCWPRSTSLWMSWHAMAWLSHVAVLIWTLESWSMPLDVLLLFLALQKECWLHHHRQRYRCAFDVHPFPRSIQHAPASNSTAPSGALIQFTMSMKIIILSLAWPARSQQPDRQQTFQAESAQNSKYYLRYLVWWRVFGIAHSSYARTKLDDNTGFYSSSLSGSCLLLHLLLAFACWWSLTYLCGHTRRLQPCCHPWTHSPAALNNVVESVGSLAFSPWIPAFISWTVPWDGIQETWPWTLSSGPL